MRLLASSKSSFPQQTPFTVNLESREEGRRKAYLHCGAETSRWTASSSHFILRPWLICLTSLYKAVIQNRQKAQGPTFAYRSLQLQSLQQTRNTSDSIQMLAVSHQNSARQACGPYYNHSTIRLRQEDYYCEASQGNIASTWLKKSKRSRAVVFSSVVLGHISQGLIPFLFKGDANCPQ